MVPLAQKRSDNILKSSSFLPASVAARVREVDGVEAASPLLRVITKAAIRGRLSSTLFLFGFDPTTRLGAPAGVSELHQGEIVFDEAFARKYALTVGDTIAIQRKTFRVVLLCDSARNDGRAVVIVSHDTRIAHHADRVVRMADGRLT